MLRAVCLGVQYWFLRATKPQITCLDVYQGIVVHCGWCPDWLVHEISSGDRRATRGSAWGIWANPTGGASRSIRLFLAMGSGFRLRTPRFRGRSPISHRGCANRRMPPRPSLGAAEFILGFSLRRRRRGGTCSRVAPRKPRVRRLVRRVRGACRLRCGSMPRRSPTPFWRRLQAGRPLMRWSTA